MHVCGLPGGTSGCPSLYLVWVTLWVSWIEPVIRFASLPPFPLILPCSMLGPPALLAACPAGPDRHSAYAVFLATPGLCVCVFLALFVLVPCMGEAPSVVLSLYLQPCLCDSLVCLVPLLWVDGFHLVSYFSTLCVTVVLVGEGNSRHQCC